MKREKVRLSDIKREIEKYIEENEDAEVISISTYCSGASQILYALNLCDLKSDSFESIGEIKIKRY